MRQWTPSRRPTPSAQPRPMTMVTRSSGSESEAGTGDVADVEAGAQQNDAALEAQPADIAEAPGGQPQRPARGVGQHHADGDGEQRRADQGCKPRRDMRQGGDDEAEENSACQTHGRGQRWPGCGRHGNILLHEQWVVPPRAIGNLRRARRQARKSLAARAVAVVHPLHGPCRCTAPSLPCPVVALALPDSGFRLAGGNTRGVVTSAGRLVEFRPSPRLRASTTGRPGLSGSGRHPASPPGTAVINRPAPVDVSAHGSASDRNRSPAFTMRLTMANRSKIERARRSIRAWTPEFCKGLKTLVIRREICL